MAHSSNVKDTKELSKTIRFDNLTEKSPWFVLSDGINSLDVLIKSPDNTYTPDLSDEERIKFLEYICGFKQEKKDSSEERNGGTATLEDKSKFVHCSGLYERMLMSIRENDFLQQYDEYFKEFREDDELHSLIAQIREAKEKDNG